MSKDKTPNEESIVYWNEDAGPRWARRATSIDRQLAPFLDAVVRVAAVKPGHSVLDVGCGAGALSLRLAELVGAEGVVTGLDISDQLLAVARDRAAESDAANLEFRRGDAQVEPLGAATFDRVVSRFGVMFFEDSTRAFVNLRRALQRRGTLTFACWAAPGENPWMGVPQEVVSRHLEPPEPPDPDQPGPFRFCDPDYVRTLCKDAGFGSVTVDPLRGSLSLGGHGTLDEALDFMLEVGPAARARDAEETIRQALIGDLRETLRPYVRKTGVEMPFGAWLVRAVAPD